MTLAEAKKYIDENRNNTEALKAKYDEIVAHPGAIRYAITHCSAVDNIDGFNLFFDVIPTEKRREMFLCIMATVVEPSPDQNSRVATRTNRVFDRFFDYIVESNNEPGVDTLHANACLLRAAKNKNLYVANKLASWLVGQIEPDVRQAVRELLKDLKTNNATNGNLAQDYAVLTLKEAITCRKPRPTILVPPTHF